MTDMLRMFATLSMRPRILGQRQHRLLEGFNIVDCPRTSSTVKLARSRISHFSLWTILKMKR